MKKLLDVYDGLQFVLIAVAAFLINIVIFVIIVGVAVEILQNEIRKACPCVCDCTEEEK